MLIGNKCDLSQKREVSKDDAHSFTEHYGIGDNLETSAKVSIIGLNGPSTYRSIFMLRNY